MDPASEPDITLGVSCYNEAESIPLTLANLTSALERTGLTAEVLVMDDCSADGSAQAVQAFCDGFRSDKVAVVLHRNTTNQGLVWNVFEAARIGHGRYFWMVSGDNSMDPDTYAAMLGRVGSADLIIPNVLYYRNRPPHRKIISRMYSLLVNVLSGRNIRYYNGGTIFKRATFVARGLEVQGFGYSAELILSLLDSGATYVEADVIYNDRLTGSSSALRWKNLREIAGFFGRLIKRRVRRLFSTDQRPGS